MNAIEGYVSAPGEISVVNINGWNSLDLQLDDARLLPIVNSGKAIAFYTLSWRGLKDWVKGKFPGADVWYTERNGDCIGLIVPGGTLPESLPSQACDYATTQWIDPEADFGKGAVPVFWKKQGVG